jgi:hypothetical protein
MADDRIGHVASGRVAATSVGGAGWSLPDCAVVGTGGFERSAQVSPRASEGRDGPAVHPLQNPLSRENTVTRRGVTTARGSEGTLTDAGC